MNYSEAELKLIRSFKTHFPILTSDDFIFHHAAPRVYDDLSLYCFILGLTGSNVDALRKVISAIIDCTAYRGTKEFDELCSF